MSYSVHPIGSKEWWLDEKDNPTYGPRGLIDCILRLLEQEEISRAKAGELVNYVVMLRHVRPYLHQIAFDEVVGARHGYTEPPSAPWDKLNFYERSSDGVL